MLLLKDISYKFLTLNLPQIPRISWIFYIYFTLKVSEKFYLCGRLQNAPT